MAIISRGYGEQSGSDPLALSSYSHDNVIGVAGQERVIGRQPAACDGAEVRLDRRGIRSADPFQLRLEPTLDLGCSRQRVAVIQLQPEPDPQPPAAPASSQCRATRNGWSHRPQSREARYAPVTSPPVAVRVRARPPRSPRPRHHRKPRHRPDRPKIGLTLRHRAAAFARRSG